jgi:asparagine synthase (glutamine-hydrolysing)
MCGIAGLLATGASLAPDALEARVAAMAAALAHRGPDSDGVWTDPEAGIGLGHRRLAILDLSPAGAQPMVSASGRMVIAFNGETYNYPELRAELEAEGVRFRGGSDTEAILEAADRWGVERTLARLNGITALALWDRRERRLWLARDRLGVKPLYWAEAGGMILFGSELKALVACAGWRPALDREALAAYLRWGYVPAPRAIYAGARKLEPGSVLSVAAGETPRIVRYWDLDALAQDGASAPDRRDEAAAADELEALLGDAVARQMLSDVPLGAFLSGGVDSSTVVALMQARSLRPVRTFTVGFDGGADEAPHARAVAAHLGTDHTELRVGARDALAMVPKLAEPYDEPFADSSAIPTCLVSALTREHVTVSLSGDGGDELFAGYGRYAQGLAVWQRMSQVPAAMAPAVGAALGHVPERAWDALFGLLPASSRPNNAGFRARRVAALLADRRFTSLYGEMVQNWWDPALLLGEVEEFRPDVWSAAPRLVPTPLDQMRLIDFHTYLPDDILVKVDRASMAVGLEARVPLLDHRVVEFAWRLPAALNPAADGGKRLLRKVLYRHVPRTLIERPKQGFAAPVASWLRGPLRDWAEDLLSPASLEADGLFRAAPVRAMWARHLKGQADEQHRLWTVLMAQAWRRRWL